MLSDQEQERFLRLWADASDEAAARPSVWTEWGPFVDEFLRVTKGQPQVLERAVTEQENLQLAD